jgi:hypothetical protein
VMESMGSNYLSRSSYVLWYMGVCEVDALLRRAGRRFRYYSNTSVRSCRRQDYRSRKLQVVDIIIGGREQEDIGRCVASFSSPSSFDHLWTISPDGHCPMCSSPSPSSSSWYTPGSPVRRGQASGSFAPPPDAQTFRDLLLFEERLKPNALALKRRKRGDQCTLAMYLLSTRDGG